MKSADLRAIIGRMTDAPWYPRARFLSRVANRIIAGATMHTNWIGTVANHDDAIGAAVLRNHADAWIVLQDAVSRWRSAECTNSGPHCLEGTHIAPCAKGVTVSDLLAAHSAIEDLP